jgi:hypothetical protein
VVELDKLLPLMMDTWRAQAERNSKRTSELAQAVAAADRDDSINFEEFTELIGVCTEGTYSKRQIAALFRDGLKGSEKMGREQFVLTCYLHGFTVPLSRD